MYGWVIYTQYKYITISFYGNVYIRYIDKLINHNGGTDRTGVGDQDQKMKMA